MSIFGSNPTPSKKINVIAQIRAKSGHEDKVRTVVEGLAEPSLKEPGCLSYKAFEDKHYTGSFYTFEEWESEAALDQHLAVNKAALDGLKALLREELRINVLQDVG
jgi:quinol monooxygenase YgiN